MNQVIDRIRVWWKSLFTPMPRTEAEQYLDNLLKELNQ